MSNTNSHTSTTQLPIQTADTISKLLQEVVPEGQINRVLLLLETFNDDPIVGNIETDGSLTDFVQRIWEYGNCTNGALALCTLLEHVHGKVEPSKQAALETVLAHVLEFEQN